MQSQPRALGGIVGLQPTQHVDLLVDLAALREPVDRLDGAGLDAREPVQLEGVPERVDARCSTARCSGSSSGNPLSGLGLSFMKTGRSWRNGFAARSRPIVVCSPCPASTTMSSASGSTLLDRVRSMVGWSPPGRSVRPIEPAKSRSPEKITSETSSTSGYGVRKVTEPSVWPGVWSTTKGRRRARAPAGHSARVRRPARRRCSRRRASSGQSPGTCPSSGR